MVEGNAYSGMFLGSVTGDCRAAVVEPKVTLVREASAVKSDGSLRKTPDVRSTFQSRLISLLIQSAIAASAQAPAGVWALPSQLAEPEWMPLFNGKDLGGWVPVGNDNWKVENGAIHGLGTTKEGGYLRTESKFKDFHLSVRFKCNSDGNSGIFFRSEFEGGKASHGLQFEIDRKPNYRTGAIYGDGRRFIVFPTAENEMALRPDDWNHFLLKVIGNRYICYLNSLLLVDFTDPSPKSFDGYIALQLHGESATTSRLGSGDMWFKDIYIRDLSKR